MEDFSNIEQLNKWRLMLGRYAENSISFDDSGNGSLNYMGMDDVLDYLYSREYGEDGDFRLDHMGGSDGSGLTISGWINEVRELFPKDMVEILEKEALERYGLTELLTDKEFLDKLVPSQELLKMIMQLKPSMNRDVLDSARRIVRAVVEELMKQLENDVKISITGLPDRNQESPVRSSKNFDIKKTIKNNLKHYDRETGRLVLEKVYFYARQQLFQNWHVIIAVDESGSMLDSVIHSAITAGIFAKLPMLDTKLVIFDTKVVDLSDMIEDPVETLMSIQLGGGTNISAALGYCESLMTEPEKTIMILVTDLYEGGNISNMYAISKSIIESGAKLLVLTALDKEADPNYNRQAAAYMASLGAHVGAMTPKHLAEWVGGVING